MGNVQEFLDGLVEGMEREKPGEVNALRERLVAYFSPIDGVILEYERNPKLPAPAWHLSQRNPLSRPQVKISDDTVYFMCRTHPDWTSGGFKYLHPTCSEFAFLREIGLYVAMGNNEEDQFSIHHEAIYIPEKTIQELS